MGITRLVHYAAPIALIWSGVASAQMKPWEEYRPISTITTAMIADECSKHQADRLDPCAAYILGVADTLSTAGKFCLTSGSWSAQVVAVAAKYLRDHPEQWNLSPSWLIGRALSGPFPCPFKK